MPLVRVRALVGFAKALEPAVHWAGTVGKRVGVESFLRPRKNPLLEEF